MMTKIIGSGDWAIYERTQETERSDGSFEKLYDVVNGASKYFGLSTLAAACDMIGQEAWDIMNQMAGTIMTNEFRSSTHRVFDGDAGRHVGIYIDTVAPKMTVGQFVPAAIEWKEPVEMGVDEVWWVVVISSTEIPGAFGKLAIPPMTREAALEKVRTLNKRSYVDDAPSHYYAMPEESWHDLIYALADMEE